MGVYIWSRLPSEYQEVEYIQSSGTQWLQIGTSFKTSYKTVVDFQMTATGSDQVVVGVYKGGVTKRYGIDAWQSKFKVITGGSDWSNTISEDTNRHLFTIDKSTVTVDGTNYSCAYSDYTYTTGLGVFTYLHDGQVEANSKNKLYKLDIYDENGVHIHDLIPCYRKSDSVIGLYDLVNNQFYTNSGTGTFTKGSDVNTYREKEMKNAYIGEVWTPTSNTIAYYPLTSSTTVNDQSGNNRNLTNSNVTFGTYKGVNCAYYSSSSTTIYGTLVSNQTACTISVWAYFVDYGSLNQNLVRWGSNFGPWVDGSTNKLHCSPGTTGTNTLTSDSKWIYVTVTFNGSNIVKFYNNGTLIATNSSATVPSGTDFAIGSNNTHNSQYWKGGISEVIIENKVRTDQEIANYYNTFKANYGL